jgi:hypothetical protein
MTAYGPVGLTAPAFYRLPIPSGLLRGSRELFEGKLLPWTA